MVRNRFWKLVGVWLVLVFPGGWGTGYAQYGGYTGSGRCVSGCNIPTPPSGGTSVGTGTNIDNDAERRAREEAERQRAETERREQERLRAEQQRKFNAERDAAVKSLKGGGNSASFGLKGVDSANSGLRVPHERVERDLTGQQAAWKQLHCAASILGPALAALAPPPGGEPDFAESRYLLSEAQNALNGQRLGVQCAAAPAIPQVSGRAPDMDRAMKIQRRLISRAGVAIDQLEQTRRARTPDEERIARAYEQQGANEAMHDSRIAPIREQQRQINREREKKPGQQTLTPPVQETQAKQELEKIAAIARKIEEGKVDLGVDFAEEPAAPRPRSSGR